MAEHKCECKKTKIDLDFPFIIIWILFCVGDPDLLDGIIHYLMTVKP